MNTELTKFTQNQYKMVADGQEFLTVNVFYLWAWVAQSI